MRLPRLRAVTPSCEMPRIEKPYRGQALRLRQPLRRAGTPSGLAMTMTDTLGLDRQFEFVTEDADDAASESENGGRCLEF